LPPPGVLPPSMPPSGMQGVPQHTSGMQGMPQQRTPPQQGLTQPQGVQGMSPPKGIPPGGLQPLQPLGMPHAAQRAGIGHAAAMSERHHPGGGQPSQESKRGNPYPRGEAERGEESKRARNDRCARGLQPCTCHAHAHVTRARTRIARCCPLHRVLQHHGAWDGQCVARRPAHGMPCCTAHAVVHGHAGTPWSSSAHAGAR